MNRDSATAWAAALDRGDAAGWREFPEGAAEFPGISRRRFVQLLGASLALAGLGGCIERPREKILPYISTPPEAEPGRARWYATTMTLGGFGTGLLVESHEGRPTKIEGNPDHPASLGAAGVYQQASLLQLYDPQRARRLRQNRETSSWAAFTNWFAPARLRGRAGARGAGLRFLIEPTGSPLLRSLLLRLRELYPEAVFHSYAPLASRAADQAASLAFGGAVTPLFDFRQSDVILALDADFLASGPFQLRYARDFAARRRPSAEMNRLYVVEPVLSVTGASADHRLRAGAAEVEGVLGAVVAEVIELGHRPPGMPAGLDSVLGRYRSDPRHHPWAAAVARDLARAGGRSAVIAGDLQSPRVHMLAHLLNQTLGNVGTTVSYIENVLETPSQDLRRLVEAMRSGSVQTLVMLETNPLYTAPADLDFAGALRHVPETVAFDLFEHETGGVAQWFVPAAHYLESWGDARACDGTASIVQPLIAPLYGGKTAGELLAAFLGEGNRSSHDLVQNQWRSAARAGDFDSFWNEAVQRGVIPGSAAPPVRPSLKWESISQALAGATAAPAGMEIVLQPDPSVYDGRFGNNAWLQELPDPMTKLTWGNAALVSPATAAKLRLESGDRLRLRWQGRELTAPAYVLPGVADEVVALRFGYGRRSVAEELAHGVGVNAFLLSTSEMPYGGSGLQLERIPGSEQLATTQTHWSIEDRPIALHATLAEYREHPDFARRQKGRQLSLYQGPPEGSGDQWAMTIDLSACTGCSACVVACQAENNIPVVGPEGVLKSREMHWIRVDRYFSGTAEEPAVIHQPMLCQHCEKAPCEYVCPVNATAHSPDGLNEMIYNRCVGTRFCSNNCPYKVRRFNWFDYNAELSETERMARNPDVTVRARGVMEKCTFCVQRIREAQIEAKLEGRPLRDGEVRTACQQACPTQAIVFGSLNDHGSAVLRSREEPRSYAVLHELGTEPRVRYLARITNPNPELRDGG